MRKEQSLQHLIVTEMSYKMTDSPHGIILRSFTWSKTDEGYDFWYDIYKKVQLI